MNLLEVAHHDPMLLISQYYLHPVKIISHFVPEQGAPEANIKPRPRRRKNKGGEGGGDVAMMMMRKRRLNEEQVSMLEQSFGSEKKLEPERKDRLAAELGLDPHRVAVWFQNRRARWRNKKLEEEYSRLKSEHETTVVEKCLLENELLKVMEELHEAEKEIKRLSDTRSNSPACSSLLSMKNNMETPLFQGEFGMKGLENLFYLPVEINNYNYCGHGVESGPAQG